VFARQPDIRDTVSARELNRPCPEPATLRAALVQLRDIVVDVYREARDSPWHLTHERLIDDNPELHDRHVRKLLQFGDDMAALLEHRGAKRKVAVVAAHTAVACCLAARTLRSTDTSMADAVAECFGQYWPPTRARHRSDVSPRGSAGCGDIALGAYGFVATLQCVCRGVAGVGHGVRRLSPHRTPTWPFRSRSTE
jgi:hypothetical protein